MVGGGDDLMSTGYIESFFWPTSKNLESILLEFWKRE